MEPTAAASINDCSGVMNIDIGIDDVRMMTPRNSVTGGVTCLLSKVPSRSVMTSSRSSPTSVVAALHHFDKILGHAVEPTKDDLIVELLSPIVSETEAKTETNIAKTSEKEERKGGGGEGAATNIPQTCDVSEQKQERGEGKDPTSIQATLCHSRNNDKKEHKSKHASRRGSKSSSTKRRSSSTSSPKGSSQRTANLFLNDGDDKYNDVNKKGQNESLHQSFTSFIVGDTDESMDVVSALPMSPTLQQQPQEQQAPEKQDTSIRSTGSSVVSSKSSLKSKSSSSSKSCSNKIHQRHTRHSSTTTRRSKSSSKRSRRSSTTTANSSTSSTNENKDGRRSSSKSPSKRSHTDRIEILPGEQETIGNCKLTSRRTSTSSSSKQSLHSKRKDMDKKKKKRQHRRRRSKSPSKRSQERSSSLPSSNKFEECYEKEPNSKKGSKTEPSASLSSLKKSEESTAYTNVNCCRRTYNSIENSRPVCVIRNECTLHSPQSHHKVKPLKEEENYSDDDELYKSIQRQLNESNLAMQSFKEQTHDEREACFDKIEDDYLEWKVRKQIQQQRTSLSSRL